MMLLATNPELHKESQHRYDVEAEEMREEATGDTAFEFCYRCMYQKKTFLGADKVSEPTRGTRHRRAP